MADAMGPIKDRKKTLAILSILLDGCDEGGIPFSPDCHDAEENLYISFGEKSTITKSDIDQAKKEMIRKAYAKKLDKKHVLSELKMKKCFVDMKKYDLPVDEIFKEFRDKEYYVTEKGQAALVKIAFKEFKKKLEIQPEFSTWTRANKTIVISRNGNEIKEFWLRSGANVEEREYNKNWFPSNCYPHTQFGGKIYYIDWSRLVKKNY